MAAEENWPTFDWRNPLPGNPHLVAQQIERLRGVRDSCGEAVTGLHKLDLSSWEGKAAESFDDVRRTQLKQWANAENALTDAVDALTNYNGILDELQSRARTAVRQAEVVPVLAESVHEDIIRWRSQLDAANVDAARTIQAATSILNRIHRQVATDTATAHPEPTPTVSLVEPPTKPPQVEVSTLDAETTNRLPVHKLIADQQSPADLRRYTLALCTALLEATYTTAEAF